MTWHCKSHLFKSTGWMNIVCHICTVLRHLYYSDNIVLLHYKTCTLCLSPAVTRHSFTITLLVSNNDVKYSVLEKKYELSCSNHLLYIHYLSVVCSTKARQKRELCYFTKILRTWCSDKLCSNFEV